IEAEIANARAVLELDEPLDDLLWSFAPPPRPNPRAMQDVPATSPESHAMARELKRRGFKFLGPTTCYALMQATGMVDDHVADCWRAGVAARCRACGTRRPHAGARPPEPDGRAPTWPGDQLPGD